MLDLRSLVPFGTSGSRSSSNLRDPVVALRREMDRLFDDFLQVGGAVSANGPMGWSPQLDVTEDDKAIVMSVELPGVDEKDVEVSLIGDVLTIKGEKKEERARRDGDIHLMERSFGRFSRSLRLPFEVDDEKVEASFANGVLTVRLPKPEGQRDNVRRIEIKSAA